MSYQSKNFPKTFSVNFKWELQFANHLAQKLAKNVWRVCIIHLHIQNRFWIRNDLMMLKMFQTIFGSLYPCFCLLQRAKQSKVLMSFPDCRPTETFFPLPLLLKLYYTQSQSKKKGFKKKRKKTRSKPRKKF